MAIAKPETKNVITATNDRILNLANPQSPCPLVHPLESLVPNPTKMPARANPNWEVAMVMSTAGPNGVK